ncbi:hypothetical protein N7468_006478 [Penicillium chermesinum]|uniref:Protoheme IX farnesyltransferase, mitochondrial n=1 Tax=Penicillium chermesinum TaxID=63820 RepID=A0A9W9NSR1_9EURO|nr:uncharacterized protein N7468_006478 [Penicillium chermesinum]KAJ5225253.1 hypothetical protein N7468_006478 [Penicillium chermesinum]
MIPLRSAISRAGARREALACLQCPKIARTKSPSAVRGFLTSSNRKTGIAHQSSTFQTAYFSPNRLFDSLKPIGGRRRRKASGPEDVPEEHVIPPDASAQLSAFSSALPTTSLRRKLAAFLALTKPRLSFLILLTTTSAYGMYPISNLLTLDPAMTPLPTLSTSTLTFIYLTTGTFLSCCSANTLNMVFEPKYDALMSRTRNRPLVRKLVSRRAAVLFAAGTAVLGLGLLYVGTNPTTTALSAANIALYAFIYTPLKRVSVINTWVGAIVGGIPPLMGWVAAAGQTAALGQDTWRDMLFSEQSIGGWLLGGILFAWQFPHFNALSHTIREEYKAAGYRMLAWTNPAQNARVALRYSLIMFPLSIGLWWVGVVGHGFLVGSTLANGWLAREAYRFWRHQGAHGTARGLFWASIWQLPILLVGGLVTKKGLWDGVWRQAFGQPEDEEDDEYLYYEDEEEIRAEPQQRPRSGSAKPSTLSTA